MSYDAKRAPSSQVSQKRGTREPKRPTFIPGSLNLALIFMSRLFPPSEQRSILPQSAQGQPIDSVQTDCERDIRARTY